MTNFVFSDAASVCLMDEVECIAQELQDWEGFVPFYFPGQAQGYLHVRAERLAQIQSPLGLLDLKSPLIPA
jgi:hypothetical protein